MPTVPITLAAGEGAILTGVASAAGYADLYVDMSPFWHMVVTGIIGACAYLGYSAYTSKV